MVEGRDLLDGDFAATRSVYRRAHDTVRALSDDIKHLVVGAYQPSGVSATAVVWRDYKEQCSPTLKRTLRGAGCACEAAWPCFDLEGTAAGCCVAVSGMVWTV